MGAWLRGVFVFAAAAAYAAAAGWSGEFSWIEGIPATAALIVLIVGAGAIEGILHRPRRFPWDLIPFAAAGPVAFLLAGGGAGGWREGVTFCGFFYGAALGGGFAAGILAAPLAAVRAFNPGAAEERLRRGLESVGALRLVTYGVLLFLGTAAAGGRALLGMKRTAANLPGGTPAAAAALFLLFFGTCAVLTCRHTVFSRRAGKPGKT
ncbi:MAG TPA: hypothetical protein PLZ73_06030 [bacterium]|nr:hypothetical protein [bacterium]